MSKLYRLPHLNTTASYFNSELAARRRWQRMSRAGEEPERIETIKDPAGFCENLETLLDTAEKERDKLLFHLKELFSVVPDDILKTLEWSRALAAVRMIDPKYEL